MEKPIAVVPPFCASRRDDPNSHTGANLGCAYSVKANLCEQLLC